MEALDDVPKFIRRNTRLAARITTMRRQDIPEYPEVALREVLVNAIAHADYSLTGMRIRVAIYADRMEIENPGMLPFGMTLDDLKAGVSRIRNRVIARVLRELGLLEEWGTGYRRVTEDCRTGGYPAPEWEERGPALRVVFRPHPDVADAGDEMGNVPDVPVNVSDLETANETLNETVSETVNARQQWFMEQLAAGKRARWSDLAAHWNVSRATALRDIADLHQQEKIEFVGAPKNGFYRIRIPSS